MLAFLLDALWNWDFNVSLYNQHSRIEENIVSSLSQMLDEHNAHAKSFRMARDRLKQNEVHDIKLRLIANHEKDGRIYNVPTALKASSRIVAWFAVKGV